MKKQLLGSAIATAFIYISLTFSSCLGILQTEDNLRDHLINSSWRISGSTCDEFGFLSFREDNTGSLQLSGCNGQSCNGVFPHDWSLSESGTLTMTYKQSSSAWLNSCNLPEYTSDVQTITTTTDRIEAFGFTFVRND